jgi:Endonuclease NucS C-terminal domain
MKQWLRDHPEHLPPGVETTTSTSHQLRSILRKKGWTLKESPNEISLIPPGADMGDVESILGEPEGDEEEATQYGDQITFNLEYQLRDFIASNMNAIDVGGRRLRLYIDPTGREGIEYPTEVGPIDILATDESGSFFVFELKRASSPDRAVGQLARYMGWVKHTIGKDRAVSGVIVAKNITEKLKLAALVLPNVHRRRFSIRGGVSPKARPGARITLIGNHDVANASGRLRKLQVPSVI